MQKPKPNAKRTVVNVVGSFGYFFCFSQWFWAIMLYFSVIQPVIMFVAPPASPQAEPDGSLALTPPSLLEIIIAVAVTVIMLALTVYVLVKMPGSVAKTSRKVVHKTTDTIAPLIIKAQHEKDTKETRIRLTATLLKILKTVLVVVPLVLAAMSWLLAEPALDYSVAMVIASGLAGLSLLFFAIQYLLAGWLRVRLADLW